MKKRLLSILLCTALMILSMLTILPITAFAGDPEITVYTVAGASDLLGSEWDPADDANNMTDMGDGSFQLVKENVVLRTGDYDYKVVGNHEWGIGECPEFGNKTLTIDEEGIYTVTFTFVPDQSDLTAIPTIPTPQYQYTEYENWQLKHEGSGWEWTENLMKVEEGLFKLADADWTGSGFNVASDENPIKKDWYAPEELTLGEEVTPPINVDVYVRIMDDETLKIGVGVEPPAPGPAWPEGAPTTAPAAPAHDGASILGAALTTDYAFEALDWPGTQPVQLTFATGETIYFLDRMSWQIYTSWDEDSYDVSQYTTLHVDLFPATGTEIEISFEGLTVDDGGQGYKNHVVKALTAGQWNGLDIALSEFPALSSGDAYDFSDIRYFLLEGYNAEQTALSVGNVYFYGAPAHTHAGEKQNGQPATEEAAGFKDYYKCDCGIYFEDEDCTVEIGDDAALAAWKAEGGNGHLDKLPHSHNFVKHNAVEAGKDTAGCKEYYLCSCGEAYEDEARTKKIENLGEWMSVGGAGYLAPTGDNPGPGGDDPEPSGKGGANLVWLWILLGLLLLLIVIYVVVFFIWKKKEEMPAALAFLGFLAPSYKAINGALFKKEEKKE